MEIVTKISKAINYLQALNPERKDNIFLQKSIEKSIILLEHEMHIEKMEKEYPIDDFFCKCCNEKIQLWEYTESELVYRCPSGCDSPALFIKKRETSTKKEEYEIVTHSMLDNINKGFDYAKNIGDELLNVQKAVNAQIDAFEYSTNRCIVFIFNTEKNYEQIVAKITDCMGDDFYLAEKYRRSICPRK